MKNGSCIIEISSLKSDIFSSLLKIPEHLTPLSIHPMFGPGAKNLSDTKILIIPIRNEKREQNLVKSLFSETRTIIIKDPQSHDSIMAILLGMIYYVNLILASTLSRENITLLKKVSGTTFYLQELLCESILTDHSSLIASLLADNKQLVRYLRKYNEESAKLFGLITNNKNMLEKRINRIRKGYTNKKDIGASYEKMYSIISKMKNE
jgi:prephenate dehydrogenase